MTSRPRAPILQRVTTALGTTWVEKYPREPRPTALPAVCLVAPTLDRGERGVVYERDEGAWVATGWMCLR